MQHSPSHRFTPGGVTVTIVPGSAQYEPVAGASFGVSGLQAEAQTPRLAIRLWRPWSPDHATAPPQAPRGLCEPPESTDKGDVTTQIALQPALRFTGGGHSNHSIFWTNLSPNGGGEPKGELLEVIKRDFGSFAQLKKLTDVSACVPGSGWGWLGFRQEPGGEQITACLLPLLGIDVWQHAYYLHYKNVRPGYLKAIWNGIQFSTENFSFCK
uniref:superoxide dismutase n=1 Tax=Rhinolophus ferrumequinum TaxID=59479 RepID=A0A671DVB5_RHIFE